MTRPARLATGAAALLPALVVSALPALTEAALTLGARPGPAIAALLGVLVASLAVVLSFAWVAAGWPEKPFEWRLGWVLSLTLFGPIAAPAFWALHIRLSAALTPAGCA